MPDKDDTQKITEALYQHNVELAVKNKTLSLLEKLYQTSILTLTPREMGQAITDIIREDLNFEFAGILIFEKEEDLLIPLAFSKSERLNETLDKLGFHFRDININNVSKRDIFKQVVISQTANMTNKLEDVWKELIKPEHLVEIETQSNIKTILLHPLKTGAEVLGVLLLGLNRDYETLNAFEKESIKSFINMIAVSLDKAFLYKDLQDANEKLKSLDKLKTEFLSLASHQLRSPLTAIKGYSSMLLEGSYGPISDIQKESADKIFKSSERMNHMIVRFLDVAKIEQGGMQYVMKLFDLEVMVEEIVKELSVMAKERGLEIIFETDNKMPYEVNGDKEQLWQVVQNLVDNSIKYTKIGWIKVKLSKDEMKKKIILNVSDSGMGIKSEVLPTLFQKFSRGEGNKLNVEGSGIGLYLAKHIIEDHKGRIWAESEGENKGASFFMELDDMG